MMEKISLKKRLENLIQGKDMLVCTLLFIISLFVFFFSMGKVFLAYDQANDVKTKTESMKAYVEEYSTKAGQLNHESYRPVKNEQVENVQSNILLLLQVNQMNLIGFKNVKTSEKNQTGQIYEIDFLGSWPATVQVLRNFHVRDALISTKSIKFVPDKGGAIKTTMQYKIYSK